MVETGCHSEEGHESASPIEGECPNQLTVLLSLPPQPLQTLYPGPEKPSQQTKVSLTIWHFLIEQLLLKVS